MPRGQTQNAPPPPPGSARRASTIDSEIGRRTLQNFKPGVPVTVEGFAYAAAGVFIGYTLFSALFAFLALPFRRRRPVYR